VFLHEASRSLVVEELSFVSIPNAAVLQVADAHDRALILAASMERGSPFKAASVSWRACASRVKRKAR